MVAGNQPAPGGNAETSLVCVSMSKSISGQMSNVDNVYKLQLKENTPLVTIMAKTCQIR